MTIILTMETDSMTVYQTSPMVSPVAMPSGESPQAAPHRRMSRPLPSSSSSSSSSSSLLSNSPLLFILLSMAFASSHFSVLCFNPLVAASSGGSTSSRVSPYNLTVTSVNARAATVHWEVTSPYLFSIHHQSGNSSSSSIGGTPLEEPMLITGFRMTLKPTFPLMSSGNDNDNKSSKNSEAKSSSSHRNFPITVTLDARQRSYTFKGLLSRTEYQVYIVAQGEDGNGNASETITFTTLEEDKEIVIRPKMHPAEVILVILILIAWFCAIALFLHKWGKIRIIQPREPRYKHSPKNLHTIKVVKKPTDSVIHKHYTRQMSRNMLARENKRIERMNTMPNIKVNTEAIRAHEQLEKKFQTMPVIEMETLSPTVESCTEDSQT